MGPVHRAAIACSAVFGALAVAGACTLTTSLSGLAGGTAGALDGASGVLDAGSDDGRASVDGGFCATLSPKPTFCDDFERREVQGPWALVSKTPGTSLALEKKGDGGTGFVATIPDSPTAIGVVDAWLNVT